MLADEVVDQVRGVAKRHGGAAETACAVEVAVLSAELLAEVVPDDGLAGLHCRATIGRRSRRCTWRADQQL